MKKIYLLSGAILVSVTGFSQTAIGNVEAKHLSSKALIHSVFYDSSNSKIKNNAVINKEAFLSLIGAADSMNQGTKARPGGFENFSAPDSTDKVTKLKSPSLDKERSQQITLPYPILFIHGLGSKSSTWDSTTNFMDLQYGFTFGGRFDFCLNFDGDITTTNKNFYPTPGADIALFTNSLTAGDYYFVNFGVGNDGSVFPTSNNSGYVFSEQQAIVKQGAALRRAIMEVLQKTGRDKVILMGHSMGGLASREYLQNPYNWQTDGQHHVAKLITTGTPHGGSNSSSFGLPGSGIDEQSEAIRDLRRTYYYSNDSGIYLYGGLEFQDNNAHMDDNANFSGIDFKNVDVNCNGISGELITGLNHKSLSQNLDFACIVGECAGCIDGTDPSDGVVRSDCANLKRYYNLNVNPVFNSFYYNASGTIEIHTDLPSQTYQNMQGLDEPNEFSLAYNIDLGNTYLGFTTIQPAGGYPKDYDDFKFSVPSNGDVNISINSIALSNLSARIVDSSFNLVGSIVNSNGSSNIVFTEPLIAGSYYLEIFGSPTSVSYLNPYNFILTHSSTTGIEYSPNSDDILIYPNPATDILKITNISGKTAIKLYDILGKLVMETEAEGSAVLDVSQLNGIYTLISDNNKGRTTSRVVVTK